MIQKDPYQHRLFEIPENQGKEIILKDYQEKKKDQKTKISQSTNFLLAALNVRSQNSGGNYFEPKFYNQLCNQTSGDREGKCFLFLFLLYLLG